MLNRRALRLRVGAAVAIGLVAAVVRAGHYRWTTSGPEAGFVFQIAVHPTDSNRLHATVSLEGPLVFDTADRGATWTQNEGLFTAARLVQAPSEPDVLYTTGFTGSALGVLKSSDGGTTWTPAVSGLPADAQIASLAVAPSESGLVYALEAGTPGRVFRSVDHAATWTQVSSALPAGYLGDVVVDPHDPQKLYAAASPAVVESTDGGVTWAPLPSAPNPARLFIDARTVTKLYASVSDAGLSRSTDGGATWNPASTGIADQNIRDLALDPVDPQRLWAASTGGTSGGGGVYLSTNGGQNWSRVDLGVPVNLATAIAVDPRNASFVYAAASQSTLRAALFASSDGGQTWAPANTGMGGYISDGIACDQAAPGMAYAISGANVFRTDDAGATWTLRGAAPDALVSLAESSTDSQTLYGGWVGGGAAGVVKSVDGGSTWSPTAGFATSNMYQVALSPSAPDHVLAAALEGLFGSVDGGGSWTPLLSGPMRTGAFDPADSSILYAGLSSSSSPADGLLRSADGGATWNPPAGLPTSYPHAFDVAIPKEDPTHVYAAFESGVYRSTDRGLSFAPADSGLSGFWAIRLAVDPSNAATLIAGGQPTASAATTALSVPTMVFRTHDGANSWQPVPSYIPAFSILDVGVSADGRTLYATALSGAFTFSRSFTDVSDADPFWAAVDAAAMNGVTAGCGSGRFCPTSSTSRASVAAFLLRGKNGPLYAPPPATGTVFGDVPAGSLAADFIEELSNEAITSGCGGGDFCPSEPVTRAGTAVLVLKTLHGSAFVPPPATGAVFADVPIDAFAASWIEELFHEGISAGCGGGNFCPGAPLSRGQAAALIVHAFGLS
jgi:photosystem II stability/assembly factor-like uncharacterized protein